MENQANQSNSNNKPTMDNNQQGNCADQKNPNNLQNHERTAAAILAVGNTGMQKLIPIVNKIQDVCTQLGTHLVFDIPQIAVVGSQSAGKSSVLESFVGRDFLPRGAGIVTRQPLVLQLITGPEEFGEFSHCPSKKFTDFDEIRAEIAAQTEKTSGTNYGISNTPINLCIHSPNVLNLTLVDLPGMSKNAIGDQPDNIGEIIREMILEYISKENCLILAVSPANNDLANSDALKLAREVDKDGLRTIGVITKLDLMDKGTDACDIFENKLLPLRRGYIGVVNRSQDAIDKKQDIAKALAYERRFLENSCYRHISDRMGTSYLQQVLNRQLTEHIRKTLPLLQDKLRKQMVTLEKEVIDFKGLHPDDPTIMNEVMLKILQQLRIDFQMEIGSLGATVVNTEGLTSGAKIRRIFHQRLPFEIHSILNDKKLVEQQIQNAIENLYGTRDCSLYPPYMALEAIIRMQIAQLEKPIRLCVDLIIEELSNAVRNCTQRISSHPSFKDNIENYILSFIHKNGLKFQNKVLSLIKMEAAYMNTKHEDFVNSCKNSHSRTESTEQLATSSISVGTPQNKVNSNADDVVIRQGRFIMNNFQNKEKTSTTFGRVLDAVDAKLYTEDDTKPFKKSLKFHCNFLGGSFWFDLSSKSLTCYENTANGENDKLFTIALDGLKLRNSDENSTKHIIALFNPNGQNVHPDYEELELVCKNAEEYDSWKESFSNVLNNEKNITQTLSSDAEDMSPPPEDIFDIHDKTNAYMRIVKKTICDMFPKAVTLYIIFELEKYINTDLLLVIMNVPSDKHAELFAADPQTAEKYDATKKMHETCEKALEEILHI